MGIDARILVRKVPTETVTEDWLTRTSWNLAKAIGANHFWISDGLPPDEFAAAGKAWHEAYSAHPLYKEWQAGDRSRELRERILADAGKPPECRRRAIERTLSFCREDNDPEPGTAYQQDGDDIVAAPGECLLTVSVSTRYYGEGYERGDLLTLCAIAEWLEISVPGCEVWYGGDSSGVCAEPFGAERRTALKRHLYSASGRDYFNHSFMPGRSVPPPACGLCPGGKYCGTQHGTGGRYAAFNCAGCGKAVESRDHGKTWQPQKDNF